MPSSDVAPTALALYMYGDRMVFTAPVRLGGRCGEVAINSSGKAAPVWLFGPPEEQPC